MSTHSHLDHLLQDYLDGTLPADEERAVKRHLESCTACRHAKERLRTLLAELAALPRSLEPPGNLWEGIEAQIQAPAPQPSQAPLDTPNRRRSRNPKASPAPRRFATRKAFALATVATLLVGLGVFWLASRSEPGWDVVLLDGAPQIGDATLMQDQRLRVGEWLATDAASRARVNVGEIGFVDVGPETRVQLRAAKTQEHRLALAEGRIEAQIWAPPRLFYVETPSALAIDLGCAYTLSVDSTGASLLHVTSGYVELVHEDRETLVPAGAMCRSRPGYGPGTAFDQNATPALRQALERYDAGNHAALADVLAEARATDAVTLWQLFFQAGDPEHARIYDRLATLVPPPKGVTRAGVLRRAPGMIDAWQRALKLNVMSWKGYLKKKPKQVSR